MQHSRVILVGLLLLAACGASSQASTARAPEDGPHAPVGVEQRALAAPAQPCSGAFVAHDLPAVATLPDDMAQMYDANGAGVAAGDLDGDGRLDLVVANQRGPDTILWNTGNLAFRSEPMDARDSRAVNLVDVDSDGRLDIVFTQRNSAPNFWRNTGAAGAGRFARELLPGVAKPAYAMAWGDLDGDGSLDLVTGSYDAGLLTELGNTFLTGDRAGVYVYAHHGDTFIPTRLAQKSQAMAIALYDVNGDGQRDILVGNDFAVRDMAWVRQGNGWVAATPFRTTSHSTMGFDQGDIDNNGAFDLLSTDMKPYNNDVSTLATWRPFMTEMWDPVPVGDPQLMENVLQVSSVLGGFSNQAYDRGIDATGWSWSAEFGDLDNDGWLDLYAVNGMMERKIFRYLPGHELIEQNQARRNDGSGHFTPAPQWKLASSAGGRGMTIADLDDDGDLDIVVNNLHGPAQLFENQLCGGSSSAVDLRWPGSRNTQALGATVQLHTSAGTFTRQVRSDTGYLSGAAARLHIGYPANTTLLGMDIRWPDGAVSSVGDLQQHALITVTRP